MITTVVVKRYSQLSACYEVCNKNIEYSSYATPDSTVKLSRIHRSVKYFIGFFYGLLLVCYK